MDAQHRASATASSFVPTPALGTFPGAVANIGYGRFRSRNYETADKVIPATGTPQAQGANDLIVHVFLSAVQKPARGWPVALFGHGFGGC